MHATDAVAEARRMMEICNACRYCEGYCAVFPAMELRREFSNADLSYLANLCHDCRGCFYACQYAPPHAFDLNLPRTFAQVRTETYEAYAWPGVLARLFRHNGVVVSLIAAVALAAVLLLTTALQVPVVLYGVHTGPGAFYAVVPYGTMASVGLSTFGYALFALAMGFARFWRDAAAGSPRAKPSALWRALCDVAVLRNLSGGGYGCNDRDESFSGLRRWLHHAMFYGFLACFAATSVATIYHHVLRWIAPYPPLSAPVVLGTLGGLGLLLGTSGSFALKFVRDPAPGAPELLGADTAVLVLLALVAATGLLLLGLRASGAMGPLLVVHLGFVLAFFLVLPYSKFVHGVYRFGALLRYAAERASGGVRRPPAGEQ
ncbi:MAG: tricarballylate utilization 4Fe-4S protein TcuB [Alphaproteobacteria bacterium]|nr:tricarballylate utilization 4Fe-4S protein TcuB [Alphaproteobacteria bacterium]